MPDTPPPPTSVPAGEQPTLSREDALAKIRQLWQEGVESGFDDDSDIDSAVANLKTRYAPRAG